MTDHSLSANATTVGSSSSGGGGASGGGLGSNGGPSGGSHHSSEPMLNVEQFKRLRELNMQYKELDQRLQKYDKEIYEKIYFEVFPQLRNTASTTGSSTAGGGGGGGGNVAMMGSHSNPMNYPQQSNNSYGSTGSSTAGGGLQPPANNPMNYPQQANNGYGRPQPGNPGTIPNTGMNPNTYYNMQSSLPPQSQNPNLHPSMQQQAHHQPGSHSMPGTDRAEAKSGLNIPHVKPELGPNGNMMNSNMPTMADSKTGNLINPNMMKKPDGSNSNPVNAMTQQLPNNMADPKKLPQKLPSNAHNAGNPNAPNASNTNNTASGNTTQPTQPQQPAPALTWQVCDAMFTIGQTVASLNNSSSDGKIPMPPASLGCLSKNLELSLVLTNPAMMSLREKLLHNYLFQPANRDVFGGIESENAEFLLEQRKLRVTHIKQYLRQFLTSHESGKHIIAYPHIGLPLGTQSHLTELTAYNQKLRQRKQTFKDSQYWKKQEKSSVDNKKKTRKQKLGEFHKAMLDHREAFLKFHKDCRNENSKVAKAIKVVVEKQQTAAMREEQRLELQRLQALKAHDMEKYAAMVAHTKNDRLKFLLDQTDSYLQAINLKIQEQRSKDIAEEAGNDGSTNQKDNIPNFEAENITLTKASRDYYRSTHRKTEAVTQPTMLKGGNLTEYQTIGLQWLVSLYNNNLNGILADEMGLGKTIQAIALVTYLLEVKKRRGPYLIVVPLSTFSNWVNEFTKWAPEVIKIEYKGTKEARKNIRKNEMTHTTTILVNGVEKKPFNVLITTYEYVIRDKKSLKRFPWEYIIVDEGHRMKNTNSVLFKILSFDYHSKNRLLLTGTPLQNNLPELWSLLNFLLPSIFNSVDTFDEWFNKPFAQFRQNAAGPGNANQKNQNPESEVNKLTQEEHLLIIDRLHEVLRPFVLRRVKEQVLDQLPDRVETVIRCHLSGWQRKMYTSIVSKGLYNTASDNPAAVVASGGLSNTIMQLRKVCNHPYLFFQSYQLDDYLMKISGKFELLHRMLPKLLAAGHRVLIFSQMVEVLKLLEQFCEMLHYRYLTLHGSVTSEEREQMMFTFNDDYSPYSIFLLSTRAGGLGLNLATADTVIIFDSDWNPMADEQAKARAHRMGQKNKVSVFRLLTNTSVEEKIYSTAMDKKNMTSLAIDAAEFDLPNNQNNPEENSAQSNNRELMEMLLNEMRNNSMAKTTGPSTANTSTGAAGGQGEVGEDGLPIGNTEEDEDDNDIPDDDELNEMMASYEGELELYQAMDRARYQREQGGTISTAVANAVALEASKRKKLSSDERLTQETDIPNWLQDDMWLVPKDSTLRADMMNPNVTSKMNVSEMIQSTGVPTSIANAGDSSDSEDEAGGTSKKANKMVLPAYYYANQAADSLNVVNIGGKALRTRTKNGPYYDEYYLSEEFESDTEQQPAPKAARKSLGASGASNTALSSMGSTSSVQGDEQPLTIKLSFLKKGGNSGSQLSNAGNNATTTGKNKGGRPSVGGNASSSSSAANAAASSGTTPAKRGRKSVLASFPPVYQALVAMIKQINDSNDAALFREKPLKTWYPTYYDIVPSPISIKEILARFKQMPDTGGYAYFEEIELDFALMSHNARLFNGEPSDVFLIAERVRQQFYEKTSNLRQDYNIPSLKDEMYSDVLMPSLPSHSHRIYDGSREYLGALDGSGPIGAPASKKRKL